MESLSDWFMSMVAPVLKRVMASLGLGTVTYTGLDAAVQGALGAAKSAMGGMPADIGLIVARFGFFEYMSITAGGIVGGLVWMQLKRIAVTAGG